MEKLLTNPKKKLQLAGSQPGTTEDDPALSSRRNSQRRIANMGSHITGENVQISTAALESTLIPRLKCLGIFNNVKKKRFDTGFAVKPTQITSSNKHYSKIFFLPFLEIKNFSEQQ
jgi:hypothetical protein